MSVLVYVALGLSLVAMVLTLLRLASPRGWLRPAMVVTVAAMLVVLVTILLWQGVAMGALSLVSVHGVLLALAGVLALVVLLGTVRRWGPGTEAFLVPLVVVLVTAAALVPGRAASLPAEVPYGRTLAHVAAMTGALVSLAFGGVCGLMYLVQENRLRRGSIGRWNRQLPDLERLERYNRRAVIVGFALLTAGITVGGAMMISLRDSLQYGWRDPKIVATLAVWAICGGLVFVAVRPRYRGRPVALLTIAAVLLVAVMPVVAGLVWPTWHMFSAGGGAGQ